MIFIIIGILIVIIAICIYFYFFMNSNKQNNTTPVYTNSTNINKNSIINTINYVNQGNKVFLYTFFFTTPVIDINAKASFNGTQLGIPISGTYLVSTSNNNSSATAIVSFWGTNNLTKVTNLLNNGLVFSGSYETDKLLSITNNSNMKSDFKLYFQLMAPAPSDGFFTTSSTTEVLSSNGFINYDASTYNVTIPGTYLVSVNPYLPDDQKVNYGNAEGYSALGIVCFDKIKNNELNLNFVKTLHSYFWNFSIYMNITDSVNYLQTTYTGDNNSAAIVYFQLLAPSTNTSLPFFTFSYNTPIIQLNQSLTFTSDVLGLKYAGLYLVSVNIGKYSETAILQYVNTNINSNSSTFNLVTCTSLLGNGISISNSNNLLQITNSTDNAYLFILYFLRIG